MGQSEAHMRKGNSEMTYMTSGKRSIIEQQYLTDVKEWARRFKIEPPLVRVRQKRSGGNYRRARRTISMPPNAGRDALVHEFAHHVDHLLYGGHGHGPTFRIALVQAATTAYGRAEAYNWAREYANIARWAQTHGLLKKEAKA